MNKFDHLSNPHQGDPCEICGMPSGITDNEECLGVLLEKVRDIKAEFGTILSQLSFFESRTKAMAKVYADLNEIPGGAVLEIDGAKVTVTRPKKPRVYWKGKELEVYSKLNPDVLKFREEKWSAPSIRIVID